MIEPEKITLADCNYELQYKVEINQVRITAFKILDIDNNIVEETPRVFGIVTKSGFKPQLYSHGDTLQNIDKLIQHINQLKERLPKS